MRIRLILAAVALAASLALLLWSFWPVGRSTRIQNLQPTQMQLPTPNGYVPAIDPVALIVRLS